MVFPASDLDRPERLLNVLGSFWADTYQGTLPVSSVVNARARLANQGVNDFGELLASCSRHNIPVLHVQNWYELRLLKSQSIDTTTWPLPIDFADTLVLVNRLTESSLVLVKGLDYSIANGFITFTTNPFNNALIATSAVNANGVVTDSECVLWAYRAAFDKRLPYSQYGYVTGLALPSSAAYKNFVNAYFDALLDGGTALSIDKLLALAADAPLAVNDGEVVQHLLQDTRYNWLITDRNAYRYALTATATVDVDDVLSKGQSLTDALTIYEFNRGAVPSPAQLPSLTLTAGLLANGYSGGLTFNNTSVAVVIDEHDPSGYTKVSWALGGASGDVTKFWNDTHAAGVAKNETLAMLMDTRAKPLPGQPTAASLPVTVNPLGFLLQNFFRDSAYVAILKQVSFGPEALGTTWLNKVLRQLVPVHTVCLVLTI